MKQIPGGRRGIVGRAGFKLREIFESLGLSILQMPRSTGDKRPWDIIYGTELKGMSLELGLYAKSNAEPRRVYELIGMNQMIPQAEQKVYPLLFAPYISPRTAQLCRQAGIGYFDEMGNCWINYKTILISKSVEAKLSAPRRESRQLFAPKSLRVVRALLYQPLKGWRQNELAHEVGISLGLVNRIVRRLLERAYITVADGRIYLKDRKALLDEWVKADALLGKPKTEYYTSEPLPQFEKRLDDLSTKKEFKYALTLFSGAKYRAPFVRINRLHAYLQGNIESIVWQLNIKAVPSGGNVSLILAPDEGVFYGMSRIQDRNIVSDVQLYVDLENAHGRGEEQAQALAERCLQPILRERSIEQEAKLHEFLRLRDQGDAFLFRSSDAAAAADTLGKALEISSNLSSVDSDQETGPLRIKAWLANLEAGFRTRDPQRLARANSIFPTSQEVQDTKAQIPFNSGWIKYGLMLKAALEAKWSIDQEHRQESNKLFQQLLEIVMSPYTESSSELKPKAEEVRKWMSE